MTTDKTPATLATVKHGGCVQLATVPYDRARELIGDAYNAGTHGIGYSQQAMELHDAVITARPSTGGQQSTWMLPDDARIVGVIADNIERGKLDHPGFYRNTQLAEALRRVLDAALSAQPSPGGQGALKALDDLAAFCSDDTETVERHVAVIRAALAARQPVCGTCNETIKPDALTGTKCACSHPPTAWLIEWKNGVTALTKDPGEAQQHRGLKSCTVVPVHAARQPVASNQPSGNSGELVIDAARQPVGRGFQAGVAEWMGQCFLPSLYSNMTERGDRLLEEVLELLQAHGYDKTRVATLVDYVFGRPVGEPAQEVGGVMVTLAGYCWVAGLDMHAAGDAELARINQPEVMDKIRRKQEAKNALHFDTPLPGDPAATEDWPREGDLVRYGDGSSALAIRLGPHAGGWHGYQCCGGYTFFTKAYRPSRADMDTWLDCAKYRDERTKVADNRVAHEMYLLDSQAVGNG